MRTFYLEPDEEIISVIDRLNQTKVNRVNLVVPAGAQIWQNAINLKLLKREADNLNKEITLYVPDQLKAETAEKVGLAVKQERNLPTELVSEQEESEEKDMIGILVEQMDQKKEKKKKFPWPKRTKQTTQPMVDIVRPGGKKEVKPKKEKSMRPIEPREPEEPIYPSVSSSRKWPKFLLAFIILAFLVSGLVAYFVLPNTEIIIQPKTEPIDLELTVFASKDITLLEKSLNKMPLEEVRVEKSKTKSFSASGRKQLNEKARGMVTIYNEYSSSPQTLVATTRFRSPEGKIFRIEENVVVPGAEIVEGKIVPNSLEVEVVADQPGSDYNIGPTNFTIPGFKGTAKYAGFYAESKSSMTGGLAKEVKVVSVEDLEKSREALKKELKEEIQGILEEQIPEGLKLLAGGPQEEIIEISEIEEGLVADNFELEMKIVSRALAFKEEDLSNLINFNLSSQVGQDKVLLSENQEIDYQETEIDWSAGQATLDLSIQGEAAYQIDTAQLKEDLAGQGEIEVRQYLSSQPAIEEAQVTFWPFWVKRIPQQEEKIKITISQ